MKITINPIILTSASAACLIGICFYLSTPFGLGMSPDSVGYLFGAQGMASGHGLKYLSNQWPPLYTALIGLISAAADVDVVNAARITQAVILVAVAFSLIHLQTKTNMSISIAVISMLFVFIHPAFNQIIYYAWSESLFLLLLLLNIYILTLLITNKLKISSVYMCCILLGVTSSLAFATRYVGVTLIAFDIIVLFSIFGNYQRRLQIKFIVTHLTVLVCITIPWLSYYYLTSESITRREFHWHPIVLSQILDGLSVIGITIVPWDVPNRSISIVVGGLVLITVFFQLRYAVQRQNSSANQSFNTLASGYFLFYLIFIIFSISTLDTATPLDNRILFPILTLLLLIFVDLLYSAWKISPPIKILILCGLAFTFTQHASVTYSWIRLNYFSGVEYASRDFQSRPLTQYLLQCPKELVIASNAPWEFELNLNKRVLWLPRPNDMTSGKVNNFFYEQIGQLSKNVDLIIITSSEKNLYLSIDQSVGYREIYSDTHGTVWVRNNLQPNICSK